MSLTKNVWILCHYSLPPKYGRWVRHYQLAKELKSYGWNPTIIAASNHHGLKSDILEDNEKNRLENIDGVNYLWIKTSPYVFNNYKRIINMLEYTVKVLLPGTTGKLDRPDIIIGTTAHTLAALSGELLSRRFRVPFIYEVRDIWPETMVELGIFKPRSFITRVIAGVESYLLKRAKRIITTLPFAYKSFEQYGVKKDKVRWITNGVDISSFPVIELEEHDGPFRFYYLGAFGPANGLDVKIKAMKYVKDSKRKIELYLMGQGPQKTELEKLVKELKLDNVYWVDQVEKSELPNVMKNVDGFVISILDRPNLYKYGISMNKIYDYMAAGRPVVFGGNSPNNPIKDAEAGITVSPENPEELATAMLKIANMSIAERKKMGLNGRTFLENNFTTTILGKKLADTLNEVV